MKISNKLQVIGKIKLKGIINFIEQLTEEEWNDWSYRQNVFDVHSSTRTYPIFWTKHSDKKAFDVTIFSNNCKIWNHISPIIEFLENKYYGQCVNIMFAKLLPYKQITRHMDKSDLLKSIHRIHIPIITNNKVKFFLDSQSFFLENGYIYEINNCGYHSVSNLSDQDRVHLIIDVIPKIKNIQVNYINS